MSGVCLFNFKTREYEFVASPESFEDYIPQHPVVQDIYRNYVERMGLRPVEAMEKVLSLAVEKIEEARITENHNSGINHE